MLKKDLSKFKGEFFKVLLETDKSQIGVMTIKAGGDSGPEETHEGDQIIYIIEGEARVEIGKESKNVSSGNVVIIPAGARHHIYNDGKDDLFFLTIYAPPSY